MFLINYEVLTHDQHFKSIQAGSKTTWQVLQARVPSQAPRSKQQWTHEQFLSVSKVHALMTVVQYRWFLGDRNKYPTLDTHGHQVNLQFLQSCDWWPHLIDFGQLSPNHKSWSVHSWWQQNTLTAYLFLPAAIVKLTKNRNIELLLNRAIK
jgi:hypothetical protein